MPLPIANLAKAGQAQHLCDIRTEAMRMRDRANLDVKHLQIQLEELEELQKGAKNSEDVRRVVAGLTAGS